MSWTKTSLQQHALRMKQRACIQMSFASTFEQAFVFMQSMSVIQHEHHEEKLMLGSLKWLSMQSRTTCLTQHNMHSCKLKSLNQGGNLSQVGLPASSLYGETGGVGAADAGCERVSLPCLALGEISPRVLANCFKSEAALPVMGGKLDAPTKPA